MTIGEMLWVVACECAAVSLLFWLVGDRVHAWIVRHLPN